MHRISTGSAELDAWLEGGYESDVITTLYGPAGSGKTNLCLMAAANQAAQNKKVIFIDTEGGLSFDRLKALLSDQGKAKNILVLKVTNFNEQTEAFNKIVNLKEPVGLIVVDSMVMLYRLELGQAAQAKNQEQIQAINRALAFQLKILNELARKKDIPVLITDQVYSEFGQTESVAMVGGDILKYWSKCLIELQNVGHGKKKAILRKHRSLPEKEFLFKITDKGIKKAGFLF